MGAGVPVTAIHHPHFNPSRYLPYPAMWAMIPTASSGVDRVITVPLSV